MASALVNMERNARIFGMPPHWNKVADPHYASDIDVGRVYSDTYLANPTILSLCPCSAKFTPSLNKKKQENLVNQLAGIASGDLSNSLKEQFAGDGGSIYTLTGEYEAYYSVVNMLCRTMAIMLGIGSQHYPNTNSKGTEFRNFSWDLHQYNGKSIIATASGKAKQKYVGDGFLNSVARLGSTITGTFAEGSDRLKQSVIDSGTYINFYVNGEGTSVSESMETSTRASAIENLFNESGLDDLAKDLNFLLGGEMGATAQKDIETIINQNSGTFIGNLLKNAKGYIEGARMTFPQILDDVSYGKTMSVSCRFVSLYGDVRSIYWNCLVPLAHLLPFGNPIQYSSNMYTYPFLCKATCKGVFSSDIALVSNMRVLKGGPDDRSYNLGGTKAEANGLPTEIEVQFDITPLYTKLMLSSSKKVWAAMNNTSLLEYLGTLTGLDMKQDTSALQIEMALNLISNKFTNIPGNAYRHLYDTSFLEAIRNAFHFT